MRPIITRRARTTRRRESDSLALNALAIGVQPDSNERDLDHETIQSRFVKSNLLYGIIPAEEPERLLLEPYASKPVWFIDEIEFFGPPIVEVIDLAVEQGRMIFAAGLNRDFAGRPFGQMPRLTALSEPSVRNYASCAVCDEPASRTQRLISVDGTYVPAPMDAPLISVQGTAGEEYEPRCWHHHEVPGRYEHLVDALRNAIKQRDDLR